MCICQVLRVQLLMDSAGSLVRRDSDMNWMDLTVTAIVSIVKVIKHKPGLFERVLIMLKRPTGSVYIGIILYYLIYLPNPFPRGLEVDLEGTSTFPELILLMLH